MNDLKCPRCGAALTEADARQYAGELLCEDCYMEALSPTRACDPWAVHTARSLKDRQGEHQLTPLQQRLYELVTEKGEVSFPEAAQALGLKEAEVRREFAVLRHMELLRGCKRGDLVLMTLF
jgi:transcription initiation factor IIE alpha subunit